jgi:hypothetical protein
LLLQTPAAVRWISAEPLLGEIELRTLDLGDLYWIDATSGRETIYHDGGMPSKGPFAKLDWVVVGGESGPLSRPMHPEWARSLRDQCAVAGVPFMFKQWGEWAHSEQTPYPVPGLSFFDIDGRPTGSGWHFWTEGDEGMNVSIRVGKKASGRLLDGMLHDGYPQT